MSYQAQVPGLVKEYFGVEPTRQEHPVIAQSFCPGKGWRRYTFNKRVSISWLRKMKTEGATAVALRCGARTADFTIDEIVRYAQRPLLGGRII